MNTRSSKILPAALAAAAVICGTVRFFQIISLTDTETGFFLKGSELGGSLIYILLAVFGIGIGVFAYLSRSKGIDPAYSVSSDGMGENATRFLGISEILGAFLIALNLFSGGEIFELAVIAVGAGALLASGFMLMGRIVPPALTGHLKLAAAVCFFIRTSVFFNSDLIVTTHAENLIVLMSYILATAYMASSARFYARLETKNTRILEIILAELTFLFSGTHVISDLLAMIFGGKAAAGFVSINTDICAAAVISGTFLAVLFFTSKSKDIDPIVLE